MFALIAFGFDERPLTAARNGRMTASNDVGSKPVTGLSGARRLNSASNEFRTRPFGDVGETPRRPSVARSPIRLSRSALRIELVTNVLSGLQPPARTSDGTRRWNPGPRSMITQPSGLPRTSCCASLSRLGASAFHVTTFPTWPPLARHSLTKRSRSAAPNASLRAPTAIRARRPKRAETPRTSARLWNVSDVETRHTRFLSFRSAIAGDDDVGATRRTLLRIVTDSATAIVEALRIVPTITLALLIWTSFVAPSTPG